MTIKEAIKRLDELRAQGIGINEDFYKMLVQRQEKIQAFDAALWQGTLNKHLSNMEDSDWLWKA